MSVGNKGATLTQMDKLLSNDIRPAIVGLYQALGVVVYTVLLALIINSLGRLENQAPEVLATPFFLTLLVLSAGITGSLVFGLPVYFAFSKNNVKRAVSILAYTFLFILVFILISALLILTIL